MNEPFDIVIYHANCLDGYAAAWAARKHSPDAEFIPAKYGDAPPVVEGKRVLIVDFSYSRGTLLAMNQLAADLLVLDHHKTAAEDLAGLDFAVFDMERSGCGITWDVLCTAVEWRDGLGGIYCGQRPRIIDYVEDRDLWRFAFRRTKAYIAALSALPFDFDAWDWFAERVAGVCCDEGEVVLNYVKLTVEKFASRSYLSLLKLPAKITGVLVLAVNSPPEFISDTADVLKPQADDLAIVGWFFDGERGDFVYSLRSADDGPDVSAIARAFGGGGHEHAAGFRHPELVLVPRSEA